MRDLPEQDITDIQFFEGPRKEVMVKLEETFGGTRQFREAARHCGLAVAGVLGELIQAKHAGWIPNVRDEIQRLRAEAGLFVDGSVEKFILSQVGE